VDYEKVQLSDRVILFRWKKVIHQPCPETVQWTEDINNFIEGASSPVYFVSDLRQGHVADVSILRELGKYTSHPNWGGGCSLGKELSTRIYAQTYERLSPAKDGGVVKTNIRDIVAYLESLETGITEGIDWENAFAIAKW
jgi:hypothetical protein